MCVRDVCVSFVSFMSCSRSMVVASNETQDVGYVDLLPLEIVENIVRFLNYEQTSKLRSVNFTLNDVCSRRLNEGFFRVRKGIENYIFLSYNELKVGGKGSAEMLKDFYGNENERYGNCNRRFRPVIQKILFANKILYLLMVLYRGIFTYMYYRNFENCPEDFVFLYGNCVDWAMENLEYVKSKEQVTMVETFRLKAPLKTTKHLEKMIAFYRNKNRLTAIGLNKYLETNCKWHVEADYGLCLQLNVSKDELSFLCNTLVQCSTQNTFK